MDDKSVVAVIVTYFPDGNLPLLIRDLRSQVGLVVVIDNGSDDNVFIQELESLDQQNVKLVCLGENLGIARALNLGATIAEEQGFQYLLTLDQDSRLPSKYIEQMLGLLEVLKSENPRIGFVAPNFVDINSDTEARFSMVSRWWVRTCTCSEHSGYMLTHFAITSGTIYPIRVFKDVGGFREDYFIDHVDSEFCLRLATNGYEMFVNCGVCLRHAIGYRQVYKFMGLTIKPNNHRPLRRYYIARNGLYTALRYFPFSPAYLWLTLLRLAHGTLSVVLYEENKGGKLRMLVKGLGDGIRGKLGPYSPT